VGYDNSRASSANVVFEYQLALEAARDLWALAGHVRSTTAQWSGPADLARTDWTGPKREQFDERMSQNGSDTQAVATGLEDTARLLARSWSEARGEQDRINKARYVDAELDDDNWLENGWEWIFGENDFGRPPDNPPPPAPPGFAPTRAPMYPEHQNR
jgi:hypothetical protein